MGVVLPWSGSCPAIEAAGGQNRAGGSGRRAGEVATLLNCLAPKQAFHRKSFASQMPISGGYTCKLLLIPLFKGIMRHLYRCAVRCQQNSACPQRRAAPRICSALPARGRKSCEAATSFPARIRRNFPPDPGPGMLERELDAPAETSEPSRQLLRRRLLNPVSSWICHFPREGERAIS